MTPIAPARGPRPWLDEPRTWADRLVFIAWVELALIVPITVYGALFFYTLLVPFGNTMACFDEDHPTCGAPGPTTAYLAAVGVAFGTAIIVAIAGVVLARRHRQGRTARGWVLAALALAPVATVAVWLT